MTIAALPSLAILFGQNLDYRFEVTALAINWTALIVAGVLLSVYFGTPSARHTPTTA
jgi:hypothetical protein